MVGGVFSDFWASRGGVVGGVFSDFRDSIRWAVEVVDGVFSDLGASRRGEVVGGIFSDFRASVVGGVFSDFKASRGEWWVEYFQVLGLRGGGAWCLDYFFRF